MLGLFLGGVWFFKNWQRLTLQRGSQPKLNILETRSLGARQAVFVVGYEKQRFLVATSPAGVNLLSHLPDAETSETESAEKPAAPDVVRPGAGAGVEKEINGNIQHSTFNIQRPSWLRARTWMLVVECWMFDVFPLRRFAG